jgi:hypothetical protein
MGSETTSAPLLLGSRAVGVLHWSTYSFCRLRLTNLLSLLPMLLLLAPPVAPPAVAPPPLLRGCSRLKSAYLKTNKLTN